MEINEFKRALFDLPIYSSGAPFILSQTVKCKLCLGNSVKDDKKTNCSWYSGDKEFHFTVVRCVLDFLLLGKRALKIFSFSSKVIYIFETKLTLEWVDLLYGYPWQVEDWYNALLQLSECLVLKKMPRRLPQLQHLSWEWDHQKCPCEKLMKIHLLRFLVLFQQFYEKLAV